jgi:hypothetical protein
MDLLLPGLIQGLCKKETYLGKETGKCMEVDRLYEFITSFDRGIFDILQRIDFSGWQAMFTLAI